MRTASILIATSLAFGCANAERERCDRAQQAAEEQWRAAFAAAQKNERGIGHDMLRSRLDDWHADLEKERERPDPIDVKRAREYASDAVRSARGGSGDAKRASDRALEAADRSRRTLDRYIRHVARDDAKRRKRLLDQQDDVWGAANRAAGASDAAHKACRGVKP